MSSSCAMQDKISLAHRDEMKSGNRKPGKWGKSWRSEKRGKRCRRGKEKQLLPRKPNINKVSQLRAFLLLHDVGKENCGWEKLPQAENPLNAAGKFYTHIEAHPDIHEVL